MKSPAIYLIGEDALCCALGSALIMQSGLPAHIEYRQIAGGAGPFCDKIEKMNNVAINVMSVLMIADADQAPCAVTQRNAWLPKHASNRLVLRLAVREAEAWALADHEGFAEFANISINKLPPEPETILDPKQAMLNLIKNCKRRDLREEMLPEKHARSPVGLGYNVHLSDFVSRYWRVERALLRAPSLARAVPRIATLLQT